MCSYDGGLTEVFIILMGWSHVDNLLRIYIPLCWINNCQTPQGYVVTLKVWVVLGVRGVVVFGIIYIKTGLYTVSSGRPLLVTTFSRDNKNKWANNFFCGDIYFYQLRLAIFTADQHELCLDHTIRRQMLEIKTGNAHLGIICGLRASPECGTTPKVWIQS